MTLSRIALTGIVMIVGSITANRSVEAASYEHIDTLALRIQSQSAEVYRELRLHYRHTSQFRHLISDARNLYSRAKHIHEVAHHHGSVHHLADDLRKLDGFFHHVEELVDSVEHTAYDPHHGHIHGQTSHVRRLLNSMEREIHHLREDIDAMGHHGYREHHSGGHVVTRRGSGRPIYNSRVIRIGGFGLQW